jgi:general stress protein 26
MKHTTAERDPHALQKLRELIGDITIAMITTVTPDGALRSRPMATRDCTAEGVLWFFTAEDSGKTHDLAEEHAVNVSYAAPQRHAYVSVTGTASLVRDRERVRELWDDSLLAYFPGGIADPRLALLCVRIETAEFWDVQARAMIDLEGFSRRAGNAAAAPAAAEHTRLEVRAAPASG